MNIFRKAFGALVGFLGGLVCGWSLAVCIYWAAFIFLSLWGLRFSKPVTTTIAAAIIFLPPVILAATGTVVGMRWATPRHVLIRSAIQNRDA